MPSVRRGASRTAAAAMAALLLTVLAAVPALRFGHRSLPAHLVLETVDAGAAAIVALLVYGRFRRSHAYADLLLFYGFGLIAVAGFGLTTVPLMAGIAQPDALSTWAPMALRLLGALLVAAAASVPGRRVAGGALPRRDLLAGVVLVAAATGGGWAARGWLPAAVEPMLVRRGPDYLSPAGHPSLVAAHLVLVLAYGYAAVRFAVQHDAAPGDPLLAWLGPACVVAAFSRLNFAFYPSLYTTWVDAGDLLRLGFYGLLLAGVVAEVRTYWAAQAEAAVFRERRRLARDLHDGAVQELGYIRSQVRDLLRRHPGLDAAERIAAAADRALDEARHAIAALSVPLDEPLADSLARAAADVADRYDVPLALDLDGGVATGTAHREALVRIVREAVGNAARHGAPSRVLVRLRPGELVVHDDGAGFDPGQQPRPDRYGLVGMRDRAAAVACRLRVESAPGRGTSVTVRWQP